ncbi:AAA family ATPase [Pseudomonas fluorescens]|uniref:AAA family ATPase n=1 Tax=Pseudomonas fluorescens TaxID=294 RepID=UPI00177C405F|nr:AAA family ATPase [Pseudomonas fluorescens]MBD8100423.1 AAA family ATPase [Pseudomonas fluorescens]MBD8775537.1 AAA family ATPase [Pseudomonas fluorescens]MBD8782065.1 AAA family ATPase [Pseudomonas fluorescens]MBD8794723.1 AAA family ATPase [Pseudomonas fluorescens]
MPRQQNSGGLYKANIQGVGQVKITEISIKNFKGISNRSFKLNDRFTVFIGNNATGKTTVLDALAVALGSFFLGVGVPARSINWDEVRMVVIDGQQKPQTPVEIKAKGSVNGKELKPWGRSILIKKTTTKDAKPIKDVAQYLLKLSRTPREEREGSAEAIFPVIAYHGTGRLWAEHEAPKYQKQIEGVDRAYINALSAKSSSKGFISWIKTQENSVAKFDRPMERAHLEAFKAAIEGLVIDGRWTNVKYDHKQEVLTGAFVDNSGRALELSYNQLSDGFRNVIGMIADIAFRCIQLNPHLGRDVVNLTPGVVLIDELDQHLHPNWQKRIVNDLKVAFPNIQFVATTHSPFIVQSLEADELVNLDELELSESPNLLPINKVATQVMGVDGIRSDDFEERVKDATQQLSEIEAANGELSLDDYEKISKALDQIALSETNDPEYKAFLELKEKGRE